MLDLWTRCPTIGGMPTRSSKRPRDPNQLAKLVVDLATGQPADEADPVDSRKNPAAVALGRLGGKRGGIARAAKLSPEERRRIATYAARARWGKDVPDENSNGKTRSKRVSRRETD